MRFCRVIPTLEAAERQELQEKKSEVLPQGKSMNAQFLFAARIPATITCSR